VPDRAHSRRLQVLERPKRAAAAPKSAAPAPAPGPAPAGGGGGSGGDSALKEKEAAKVNAVGDKIRELKKAKAEKDVIMAEVAKLKEAKEAYEAAVGEPFPAPAPQQSSKKKKKKK
jgi:hypothetical protein